MTDNLVRLDLSRFTRADIAKIEELRRKLRLMHRWFRYERLEDEACDGVAIFSGDRGPRRYVSYYLRRRSDGTYELSTTRAGATIAEGRTVDAVIDAIPGDFFYAGN